VTRRSHITDGWVAAGARPRCVEGRGGWGEANGATHLTAGGQKRDALGDGWLGLNGTVADKAPKIGARLVVAPGEVGLSE
jgi:hypothetical protein